jgi:hypothetical protein
MMSDDDPIVFDRHTQHNEGDVAQWEGRAVRGGLHQDPYVAHYVVTGDLHQEVVAALMKKLPLTIDEARTLKAHYVEDYGELFDYETYERMMKEKNDE